MRKSFKFIFAGIMLLVFSIGLVSCLRDSEDMKLELTFVKNIDGDNITQGQMLNVVIYASKVCNITMMIDSTIFDISQVSENRLYSLPTSQPGIHRMDVEAVSGDDKITNSWRYQVIKHEEEKDKDKKD
ncbi:MAG: hypothetical protein MJZ66_09345 [Bacteroidales bacterium]|nr:hypothetical protein [Bacteroidales bacterium]